MTKAILKCYRLRWNTGWGWRRQLFPLSNIWLGRKYSLHIYQWCMRISKLHVRYV